MASNAAAQTKRYSAAALQANQARNSIILNSLVGTVIPLLDGFGADTQEATCLMLLTCAHFYESRIGAAWLDILKSDVDALSGRQASQESPRISRPQSAGTRTPGTYFHGSPTDDLRMLRSPWERYGRCFDTAGIWFTPHRGFAEIYAGRSGRVFSVELITKNPLIMGSLLAPDDVSSLEASRFRNLGHDALIGQNVDSKRIEDAHEIVILDRRCIRYLDPDMGDPA